MPRTLLTRFLAALLLSGAAFAQMSGSGSLGGTGSVWLSNATPPLPTGSLSASNPTPTQGVAITLTYSSSGATHCNINNGILSDTTTCSGTTASFIPPFSAPGPTSTVYTFTVINASGQVGIPVTVTVSAASTSGDDSIYSTGTNELCSYPGGVTTDNQATLPTICLDTKLADTPSPGTIRTVGYSGGVLTPGTCTTDWNTVMAALVAGDVVKVSEGCIITCASGTGCILPSITGNFTHWTLIESVDPATGLPDSGFPAEGKRITPCDIGLSSVAYYPDYSTDCIARGGAKVRTFKILSPSATTPAIAIFDSNAVTPTCTAATYPCASFYRIQGMEGTNLNSSTRTSHKLIEFNGCDHCIADRNVLHSLNDPLFRVEVQGGVTNNGSHISVINNYIYDIVCANAPSGSTCVDANAVAGGVGPFPQAGQKIVNNFLAASGESWFWGGAQTAQYPSGSNPDGTATDQEVRRNHTFHPLSWFLPFPQGPFTLTSSSALGFYTGTVPGGANNGMVGKTFKMTGFTNPVNNARAVCTGSTDTSLTFLSLAFVITGETHAGVATNAEPHWDTKNLGETKATNRSLWEGNVSENSNTGFQSDQFGNGYLLTPKNQAATLSIPSGDVVTGVNSGGLHYLNCTNGGVACSTVGKPLYTCELDPNALPDWTGNGTTVASCGGSVAFGCAVGTQVGCPGSYQKLCQSVGDATHCAVNIGGTNTGVYYHILNVISPDQVQVAEDATAVVNTTPQIFRRGLNPFASVRNLTLRYNIMRHVADCVENSSGDDDGGSESRGIHNISAHDNLCYDANPTAWSNLNDCCNLGWGVKIASATFSAAAVPSQISWVHNTFAMIGYPSTKASGLINLFDNKCKLPLSGPGTQCASAVTPAYFPGLEIRDNISASALNMTAAGATFTTNTLAFAAGFYGCSGHDGVTGCDYNLQKNLLLQGLWTSQGAQLPNLHLLGSNTVEACFCTTVANGGTCTPGSPNTWSSPVTTGSLDACDPSTASYGNIFNNWDPNGGALIDLQLPSNSPYKNAGSDGLDLGANVATVLAKTAGVALQTPITQIAINGYAGNTSCTDATPCALPATTSALYGILLSRTAPNGPYTQWTVTGGSLPSGLALGLGTGVISGTRAATNPCGAGTSLGCTASFSVTAVDAAHSSDQQAYTILVN